MGVEGRTRSISSHIICSLWDEMEPSKNNDGRQGSLCSRQNMNQSHINDTGSRSCEGKAVKRGCCAQREAEREGVRADLGLKKKQELNR